MPRAGIHELWNLAWVIARNRLMQEAGDGRTFTARFEAALAAKIGVRHALTVNSGTSGLITALVAAGIGPGDEVLVPAYTWVSTAIAPLAVGAIPILVDIDESLTIDPIDLERKITPHTKAVIPVHMLNLVCDMDRILALAARHRLTVIEDACQAVGVTHKERRVGSIGDIGVFSFNQYKNISAGEGGAVLTNNFELFQKAKVYHDIGTYSAEYGERSFDFIGCNLRVSELTGAVLHAQLPRLDSWLQGVRRRREHLIEKFYGAGDGRVSLHHDPDSAVGLTFIFDDASAAIDFAKKNWGVTRIADIKRHDYVSWLPVLQRFQKDSRNDVLRWTNKAIDYSPDMCMRTLDFLSRSCLVEIR